MKPLLSAKKFSKNYGDLKVIDSISLDVASQEIVAIVGPSGAGKTTLLHLLGTLDKPNTNPKSSLTLDGVNITQLSDKAIAQFRNQKMGFIFQFHELLPEFTALENVCLPTWLGEKSQNDSESKAMELLKRLGVANRASHKPSALSGGEQQRVAVARALINDPKIIFADEPSGNLDSENAEQLHDLFFELKEERGCSFVIVTHNKELAKRADRTISLKDGKIS
ncbi:ABC transporter ATP-binding protein [Flavobacteriaceae bacterium]|jgi:lipoprotein-releasing system ATP-binding protein|nr:ABC transporter ATP-binding protein [Flavobacteriaceae bacterium]MDA9037777.1 ABC transporter ATP-binding protein [Flavobacteriaceae bacterium]MDA9587650.1 ABC transporter ATP-binding protein [Flavobacteriaceae bacterium]MDA9851934.1 ABC transporter ATP-binding protein [Flavobacteriaceae bacterium]MDC0872754.1 ABC transporter ATP-binding protein [Flavobacteriaceae bacterium]